MRVAVNQLEGKFNVKLSLNSFAVFSGCTKSWGRRCGHWALPAVQGQVTCWASRSAPEPHGADGRGALHTRLRQKQSGDFCLGSQGNFNCQSRAVNQNVECEYNDRDIRSCFIYRCDKINVISLLKNNLIMSFLKVVIAVMGRTL